MDKKMRCLNHIKLIGFLFIISATVIITLVIPSKDKKIEDMSSEIERFNSGRVFGGMVSLNANHIATRKRIDLLEVHLIKDGSAKQALLKSAMDRTVTGIRHWTKFYAGGDKSVSQNIENQIDKIVNDKTINLNTKFERLEELAEKTRIDAFERLSKAHDKRDETKAKLNKLKENRSR
jgi:hypothetical protein